MFVRISAWRQALGKDGTEKGWPDALAPAAEDAEGLAQDRSRVVFWEVSGFPFKPIYQVSTNARSRRDHMVFC